MRPVDKFISRLKVASQPTPCSWSCYCPCAGHRGPGNGSKATLSVKEAADGRVLIHCHSRGDEHNAIEVCKALGLETRDLFPEGGGYRPSAPRKPRQRGVVTPRPAPPPRKPLDLSRYAPAGPDRLAEFARLMNVTPESLAALGCGVFDGRASVTTVNGDIRAETPHLQVPERDARGNVIGVVRRYKDSGLKFTMPGSRRGLTYAPNWNDRPGGIVLLVEGASDVAACMDMDLRAVGRPSNRGGVEELRDLTAEACHTYGTRLIVVGENDRKPDGTWPGRDGARETARKLSEALGYPVEWAMVPDKVKDVRSGVLTFVRAGTDVADREAMREVGRRLVEYLDKHAEVFDPTADDPGRVTDVPLGETPPSAGLCNTGASVTRPGGDEGIGLPCLRDNCSACWPWRAGGPLHPKTELPRSHTCDRPHLLRIPCPRARTIILIGRGNNVQGGQPLMCATRRACRAGDCDACGPRLKAAWQGHLRRQILESGPAAPQALYLAVFPEDRWKAARQSIHRRRADFAAVRNADGTMTVVATKEFTGPTDGPPRRVSAHEGYRAVATAIDELPLRTGKWVSTSEAWTKRSEKHAGEWDYGGDAGPGDRPMRLVREHVAENGFRAGRAQTDDEDIEDQLTWLPDGAWADRQKTVAAWIALGRKPQLRHPNALAGDYDDVFEPRDAPEDRPRKRRRPPANDRPEDLDQSYHREAG